MTAKFTCDLSKAGRPFTHFWEHTVGSGHALLALRADWQRQLHRCHDELGFKHVRFHGLLSDDVGTFVIEQNKPVYSFFNADQIVDFLLSIGMKPFVELSFMPTALASGADAVFHYRGDITPPRDYKAWATLIGRLVQHWIDRYGVREVRRWFFEVWNEPNLKAFWTGTREDYFKFYCITAQTIKAVDSLIRVGGPATAKNEWIKEFLEFCEQSDVPVDFISTHHYPTDAFGKPGDDTITQLAVSERSTLRDQAREVRRQVRSRPLYYTEWNTSSNPHDELHDEPYAAAFIVKTIMEASGLVDAYSFWTFSDIFEENYFPSQAFYGGFGLLDLYNIPKPSYRAFQLLHSLGNEIVRVEGRHHTVDAWCIRDQERVVVVLTNWERPRHHIEPETIEIVLHSRTKARSAQMRRIDERHANAHRVWRRMGRPQYLNQRQVDKLNAASALVKEDCRISHQDERIRLQMTAAPQSVTFIEMDGLARLPAQH
jgi:xylan 1,4-beta-xylosidase